jgi:hypothetical protein
MTSMDCRTFRDKHVGFVDDVLSAAEMAEMQQHLTVCCRCARHDTGVRRGLLVARNLPQIEPSADFMERLNVRLRTMEPFDSGSMPVVRSPLSSSFALLAASVLAVAALATALSTRGSDEPILLAPVIASVPAEIPGPVASPSVVASLATGIPVWPAMFMLNEAPVHMVNVELQERD